MQIVGYDRTGGALLVSDACVVDDGDPEADPGSRPVAVETVSLAPGTVLDYRLGTRHCAGVVVDGDHHPCDAADAPHCRDHDSTWVCARCTGTCLKDEMDCYQEHAIYLAAFAPDTFKVGVTKRHRLETRLREQGADRGALVRTVENGRVAREIEAGIAERVPDRVPTATKHRGLGRPVDDDAWRALLASFDPLATFEFDYGLDLDERPVAETLATGRVRGTKGRLLVLHHAGSTYAVDLRELVGFEVTAGGTDRRLQSSLGAFG